ncbi:hypothetical protein KEM52_004364, partial [Ascosphaera acerosa]
MASLLPVLRPSLSVAAHTPAAPSQCLRHRALHTAFTPRGARIPLPRDLPEQFKSQVPRLLRREK